ncbi:MAG: hypothetical protein Q9169_001586 [Polycauliona sp. 2 TL-2023]
MAPVPISASSQALERPPARRRPLLLGVLGFLALIWILYPSHKIKPDVLHRVPHCPQENLSVAIIGRPSPLYNDNSPTNDGPFAGAGSAGASAAYYLNHFREPCHRLNITVYERNSYVGGRSTTVNVYDDPRHPVELGASIFVPINHNLVNAANRFDLPVKGRASTSKRDDTEILGIWDGQEFVFTQSDANNEYWNIARLLWKYGISPIRTQNLMKKTVGSFLKIYNAPFFPFKSLTETAVDLDLLGATTVEGQQFLEANGVSGKFGHDIIQAATRVNYGQNLDQIHGLETMVCMAAEGGMAIEGGNWQIFDSMIKDSGAALLLNTTVDAVTKESGKYTVKTSTPALDAAQDIPSTESSYDTIILASPLQFSNITFSPPLVSPPPFVPYVSLHVTLFTSPYRLSRAAFNIACDVEMPTTILTTTPPDNVKQERLPFNSISTLRTITAPRNHLPNENEPECGTRSKEYLYKIFSPEPLSRLYIESLLSTDDTDDVDNGPAISWIYEKRWDSYPYLPPISQFADMRLAMTMDDKSETEQGEEVEEDRIWYTSGIESFISSMETSSLMGMNVARLVVDGWMED